MLLLATSIALLINSEACFGSSVPLLQQVNCPLNSPNISACYVEAIETLRPYLISGNYGNGVKAVPLDPFSYVLDVDEPGLQVTIRNGYSTGMRSFQVIRLRTSLYKKLICVTIKYPKVHIGGDYTMKMALPPAGQIDGAGSFNITDDSTLKILLKFCNDANGRITTLEVVKVNFILHKPAFRIAGLYPGNPQLDEYASATINANPELLNDLMPALNAMVHRTIASVIGNLMQHV